jgi:hypothetical protein
MRHCGKPELCQTGTVANTETGRTGNWTAGERTGEARWSVKVGGLKDLVLRDNISAVSLRPVQAAERLPPLKKRGIPHMAKKAAKKKAAPKKAAKKKAAKK